MGVEPWSTVRERVRRALEPRGGEPEASEGLEGLVPILEVETDEEFGAFAVTCRLCGSFAAGQNLPVLLGWWNDHIKARHMSSTGDGGEEASGV